MTGGRLLDLWLVLFVVVGIGLGIMTGFFKARRIQPGRFKWTVFRNEAIFASINLGVTAFTLGSIKTFLTARGYITFNGNPAAWWVIALEYAFYFFLFDTDKRRLPPAIPYDLRRA
jgi:lathosterol oxidase